MKARILVPFALLLALSAPTVEPDPVVVTPSDAANWQWVLSGEGVAGGFARGPAQPLLGEGSASFHSVDANGEVSLGTSLLAGTPLALVTELAYGMSSKDGATVLLQLKVTYPGDSGDTRWLTYTPPASLVAKDQWQSWNAVQGGWAFPPPWYSECTLSAPCNWAQLTANYLGIRLVSQGDTLRLILRGKGEAYVDALSLATRDGQSWVFDFEPDPPPESVFVNADWTQVAQGADPDGEGPACSLGWDAFAAPREALDAVAPGGEVILAAGDYSGPLSIDGPLALMAEEGATLTGEAGESALNITAEDVSLEGLKIVTDGGTAVVLAEGASATLDDINLQVGPRPADEAGSSAMIVAPGASLTLEDSQISCSEKVGSTGLAFSAGSGLSLARTEIGGCGVGVRSQDAAEATGSLAFSEVNLSDNEVGMDLAGPLDIWLADSTLDGNTRGLWAASADETLSLHLERVQVLENSDLGIALDGAGVTAEMLDCDLSGNGTGLWLGAGLRPGSVALHGSRLAGNERGVVQNEEGTALSAEGNWWGAASGPGGAGPGSGDSVPPGVSFSPWALDEQDTAEATFQDGRILLPQGVPQELMQALLDSLPANAHVRLPAEEHTLAEPLRLEHPGVSLWLPAGALLDAPQGCFSLAASGVSVRGDVPGEATCRLGGTAPGVSTSAATDHVSVVGLRFESAPGAPGDAIVLDGTLGAVSLLDNRFEGLNGNAIRVAEGSSVQELAVHGNCFSGVKGFALYNLGSSSISANGNTWQGGSQGPGPEEVSGVEATSLVPWSYLDLALAAPRRGHAAERGQAQVAVEAETDGVTSLHVALSFDPRRLRLEALSPVAPFVLDETACETTSLEDANRSGRLALCLRSRAPAAGKLAELDFRVLPFTDGEEKTEINWEETGPFTSGFGPGTTLYATSWQGLELSLDRVLPSVTGRVHATGLLRPFVPGLVIHLGEGERLGYGPYEVVGTDEGGAYSLKDVVADRYPIELEAPGYLPIPFAAGRQVELGEGDTQVGPLILLPGDVHRDAKNRVDIFDASLLAEAINHKRYEAMKFCDLNGDTLLDDKDLELVQFSYGQDSLSATYYQAWEP